MGTQSSGPAGSQTPQSLAQASCLRLQARDLPPLPGQSRLGLFLCACRVPPHLVLGGWGFSSPGALWPTREDLPAPDSDSFWDRDQTQSLRPSYHKDICSPNRASYHFCLTWEPCDHSAA